MTFKVAVERTCVVCGGYVFTISEPEDAICDECNGTYPPQHTRNTASKKRLVPNSLRWEIWARDDFTCQECGTRKDLSVDHIFPEALGGKTTLENLQTLCRTCNSKKGKRI